MTTRSTRSPAARTLVRTATLTAAFAIGCVGMRVGDPNDYAAVRLDRTYPYPTEDELTGQMLEVLLGAQYGEDVPREEVGAAMTSLLGTLEHYLADAGAGVIDRSGRDLSPGRDMREAGAHRAIIARADKFRQWKEYQPPTSLFKNEEELSEDPGVCKHWGQIEVRLRVFRLPADDVARATYTLEHTDLFEETSFDETCPLDDARGRIFLEELLAEVTPCLEAPLKNGFAPVGYIEEHRMATDAGRHIYRVSMGERNGAVPGLELRIYRVQYLATRDDDKARDERVIAEGVVSEQIGDEHSWIVVDQPEIDQPILEGDLVRAVYPDTQEFTLGTGLCKRALTVHGTP